MFEGYQQQPGEVTITNIKMPFWSIVGFMIKWALASIPAFIILTIIFIAISVLFYVVLGGLGLAINSFAR